MPPILRQALVILAILAMITVNGLANALPINGQTTGAVSNRFDILFVPAGYVFSIWGVIYLLLLAYAGYQVGRSQREDARTRSVDGLVILGCAANGAWIFAWHYEQFVASLALMLVLLASLIGVYLRLDIGRGERSMAARAFVDLPFSVYLGWITVATIANASTVLRVLEWDGFGLSDFTWLVIMLGVALVLAATLAWTRRDLAFLAVLVWAFAGIAVKHADTQAVALAAGLSAGAVVVLMIVNAVRARPASSPRALPRALGV